MGWSAGQRRASGLALLLLLVLFPIHAVAQSEALPAGDVVHSLRLEANQTKVYTTPLIAESPTLLAWECNQCTLQVDEGSNELSVISHGPTMVEIESSTGGQAILNISSTFDQTMALMTVKGINTEQQPNRPAPGSVVSTTLVNTCDTMSACVLADSGTLATQPPATNQTAFLHTGVSTSTSDHHLTMDVSEGDTLEWQWLASSRTTHVQFYFQNETDELVLSGVHSSAERHAVLNSSDAEAHYWTAPENGRFVAVTSTEAARSVWAANIIQHPKSTVHSLVGLNLTEGAEILGHNSVTAPFDWSETEQLTLHSPLADVHFAVDQLLNGAWVAGTPMNLSKGDEAVIYPYPDVVAGRISVQDTPVFSVEVTTNDFSDLSGLEAPSYWPKELEIDNSSWPEINLTAPMSGEFTLAVHDTVDTYRIVVDGWSESIHFVQFTIDGEIAGLEAQMWDIDQNSGEVLATDITRPIGDELRIGLQIGRGTHYLQIRYQNATQVTQHLWGEDVDERRYVVQPGYTLMDEGDEPWFPPSEDAVYWGNVARWFMGLMFLAPVVYLGVHIRRSKAFAEGVAAKKARLAWYIERLNSGKSSAKEARVDIARALHAVSQLAWQDGLEAWGPKRIEHRTEDLALAVWSVDKRLAKNEGAWPVVVGVQVLNGEWDLAALRFDAPEGEPFEVVHVEPRFLFQGEEIFLDTMGPGQNTYILVDLMGSAPKVDIEFNGRMDGQPFAARIPETLSADS